MAIPLMSLPGYQTGNTLLNFEPIQRALDQKIRMDQVQQEQAFRQQRADKADARDDEAALRQRGEAFGNKALAFANLPAEQRDPAAWDRILKEHPDYANLPAQYRDPMKSPDLVAAEFGKFRERSQKDNLRVVGGSLLRVEPGQQPQVLFTAPREKSPLEIIMEMQGQRQGAPQSGGGQPAPRQYQPMPPTGGPRIQPQSSVGPDVMPGGVTLANDPGAEPTAPTEAPPMAEQPQQRMIDVPMFGLRTEKQALDLAAQLTLDPKTAAFGRMISDMVGPQSNPAGLQKPTVNAIEERQMNAVEKLSRLEDIEKAFDPKFLTAPEQAKQIGMSWVAWLTGKLPPEQEKSRREYVTWQRRTIANVNATIKEITGAAMSEAEAKRIRMQEADLRNDPIQFKTQLDDALRDTRLALARMHILKREGFQGAAEEAAKRLSLSDVEGRMEQRFVEIQKQIRQENPNMTPQEMRSRVRMQLRTEFGVDA